MLLEVLLDELDELELDELLEDELEDEDEELELLELEARPDELELLDEELEELEELLELDEELELLELEVVVEPPKPQNTACASPLTLSESMLGRSEDPVFWMRTVLLPALRPTDLVLLAQLLSEPVRPKEKLFEEPLIFTAIPVLPVFA